MQSPAHDILIMPSDDNNKPQSSSATANVIVGPRRRGNQLYNRCRPLLTVFKWLPVLFITGTLCWGYYAYMIQLVIFTYDSLLVQITLSLAFHALYIMTFWSYYQTIFTSPRAVPKSYWLTNGDFERMSSTRSDVQRNDTLEQIANERQLRIECRTFNGALRFCDKCNLIKPDRTHHCSVCDLCVLKMDHHCPWVNNCVSFSNYKYFVLFLGYSFFLCIYTAGTTFSYFYKFSMAQMPSLGKFNIIFLFFVSAMFAVSLLSLFIYHLYLVRLNRTTLESFRAPIFRYGANRTAYNLGTSRNFVEVFGPVCWKWFFPIYSSCGDGLEYPHGRSHPERVNGDEATNSVANDFAIKMPVIDTIE